MRTKTDYRIQFAGVTAHDDVTFPSEVLSKYGLEETPTDSLNMAVQQLDPVEVAPLFVQNPYDEDMLLPLGSANATINPDTAIKYAQERRFAQNIPEAEWAADEEDAERLTYAVHSNDYAAVPHVDFFEPWVKALNEAEMNNIGGEFRVYDNGAQIHGEIIFLDAENQLDRGDDLGRLFTGISFGNSYDGSCSMYAMGFAMDGYCRNTMRSLTAKKTRKHVGEPDEYVEWCEEILVQMGALRDLLGELIEGALEVEMDFLEVPFDVEEFFELIGLPSYLARAAATTARNRSPAEGGSRTVINFWTLHSGLTSALTHDFRGRTETGTLEDYFQIARDLLFNPSEVMSRVKREYERQQRLAGESDQLTFTGEQGLAQIERFERTLEDRKAEFEEHERLAEEMLESANAE